MGRTPSIRYLSAFLAFLLSLLLARYLQIRFVYEVIPVMWQYLDVTILRDDLLSGLYSLHSQPPLFNFFLGIVIQLAGNYTPQVLAFLFQGMVLGILCGIAYLLEKRNVPVAVSAALTILFAILPALLVYSRYAFYTVPVAFLLVLTAIVLQHAVEQSTGKWFVLFWLCVATILLTRATFNYLWFFLILGAGFYMLGPIARKKWILTSLLPFLLVTALYAKNFLLTGIFGPSSWFGMNLSKVWIVSDPRLYSLGGALSPEEARKFCAENNVDEIWLRGPFQPPDAYREFGLFGKTIFGHPAMTAEYKKNGATNFNNKDYAIVSKRMFKATKEVMRHYPKKYLKRLRVAYGMYLQPGPGASWTFTRFYDFNRVAAYRNTVTGVLLLAKAEDLPRGIIPFNLLFLIYPSVLLYGIIKSFRGKDPSQLLLAFLTVTIFSGAIAGIAFELGENDRIRWETDPLFVILVGRAIHDATKLLRRTIQRTRQYSPEVVDESPRASREWSGKP